MTGDRADGDVLVIFDCDGVLVDSERLIVDAEVRIFARLGHPTPRDEIIARFVGTTGDDFRQRIEETFGPDGYRRWKELYQDWFDREFYRDLRPVDGIREALEALPQRRCVASNSTHERVRRSLHATGLAGHFGNHVFSADDVTRGKPAPDIYLHAARTMHTPPSRCIVVEDSQPGVRAARSAGMRVLAYTGGITSGHPLEGAHTTLFTGMEDLPDLIGRAIAAAP